MEFTMTIKSEERFTEDEVDEILGTFGEAYDSADVSPHRIEIDGVVRQRQTIARIMVQVRHLIGWYRPRFAVRFGQ